MSPQDKVRLFRRLERLARLLDSRWKVPGLQWRFGVDGLASLLPVAGDVATAAVGAYIVFEARKLGISRRLALRMAANVLIDMAGGSVPVIGPLFDFAYKSNRMNIALLRRHLRRAGMRE